MTTETRAKKAEKGWHRYDPGCPACSCRKVYFVDNQNCPRVYECAECGAIFGHGLYKGDVYKYVDFTRLFDGEASRYFDFEYLGSQGLGRIHGWMNEKKQMVQFG